MHKSTCNAIAVVFKMHTALKTMAVLHFFWKSLLLISGLANHIQSISQQGSCTVFIQKSSGRICLDEVKKEENLSKIEWCHGSNLRVMDPPGPLTGLWSFPGSGNSWLRHLIQKATGYVTGSEYEEKKNWPDFPGFPGGDISNGSAVVVKSHLYDKNVAVYDRAILLMRNPLDSFISEFNRLLRNSFENAPIEEWNQIQDLDGRFLKKMYPRWHEFHENILVNFTKPLLIIEYNSLQENTIGEMSRVMNFLNLYVTNDTKICLSKNPIGPYKRPQRPKHEMDQIMQKLRKENIDFYNDAYHGMIKRLKEKFRA